MRQGSELDFNLAAFASHLLEVQETAARARVVAHTIAERYPGTATTVYLLEEREEGPLWAARATVGEGTQPDSEVAVEAGTLGMVFRDPRSLLFAGRTLALEDYAHLNVRRTIKALAGIPLIQGEELLGCIELLSFDDDWDQSAVESLEPLAEVAAAALAASQAYEIERNNTLNSITRLTQFYDIEKVFSSTLEMDELLPIIGGKMREMLDCDAINIWMVQGDGDLLLMHQAGWEPTTQQNTVQKSGEGIAADVADNGEPVLKQEPSDEQLIKRNLNTKDSPVRSLMAAPLIDKGALVGVVEAVNPLDDSVFDEDSLFVLTSLNESASIALHNASLLMAERKVEVLETLVTVSHQITSTLDLDRVLQAVVNGPATVIPYERAAIALEQRGRIQLRAVSGTTEFNPDDRDLAALSQILQWASLLREPTQISQHGEEISADREETRAKFHHYFAQTGMRALHAVPLADDEGRVGVLSFESSDPDFLNVAHLEMIKVLASQATVALRNASLYKEVPFIGVLEPLMQKKQRFLAMEKHRRTILVAAVCAALLFLALFPLPLRIEGPATVVPGHAARVGAEVEGVVKEVDVKEGDRVHRGTILGALEDWDYRSALAAAEAKKQTALSLMNKALSTNDGTEAGIQQAQVTYWTAEVARSLERLNRTVLRSPIDGVVATPHLENLVGHKLKFGENFADIVDNSQALVDLTIDQTDVVLVASGQKARIKLDGFPARTFQGEVFVVSPLARLDGDSRTFYARVLIPNPENLLRAGMQGRGKVSTGWHPAGEVFFRQPALWIWSKLWSWFGW